MRIRVVAAGLAAGLGFGALWAGPAQAGESLPLDTLAALPASSSYRSNDYDNWNWGGETRTYTFADEQDRLGVLTVDTKASKLRIATFDSESFQRVGDRVVGFGGYPQWGGFFAAPDGFYYVVVGKANRGESGSENVVAVRRYSQNWKLSGQALVRGGVSQGLVPGIADPFIGGTARMAMCGNTLVVHMARLMFRGSGGINHQGNLTLSVNTSTMKARPFDDAYGLLDIYASHSFNQFAGCVEDRLTLLDHGDAYPRSLVAWSAAGFPPGSNPEEEGTLKSRSQRSDLWVFPGRDGENWTGTRVTGFGMGAGTARAVVVGESVAHERAVSGMTGENTPRNVFLITADADLSEHRFTWLSNYTRPGVKVTEPRMARVSPEQFVVLFGVRASGKDRLEYRLVDSTGRMLASESWKNVRYEPACDPVFIKGSLLWVQRGARGVTGKARYVIGLNVEIPRLPKPLVGGIPSLKTKKLTVTARRGYWLLLPIRTGGSASTEPSSVMWRTSRPRVATVVRGQTKGRIALRGKRTSTLWVAALKRGTTKLTLTTRLKAKLIITIKVK